MAETYRVEIEQRGGQGWRDAYWATGLRDALRQAREYGETKDVAYVYGHAGRIIATYRRDPNGDGHRWYKSA